MARHGVKGRRSVVVYRPGASRWPRVAWWGYQGLRVTVPLGALALLPWAPVPAIALAWLLGLTSVTLGSAVRPPGAVVTGWRDVAAWRPVDDACGLLARSWPALGDLADSRDIRPTLARARYELAALFAARGALQKPIDDLGSAPRGLDAADPLRAEVRERRDELLARHRALTEQIEARTAALQRLAKQASEFSYQQAVADRTRRALRRASAVAGTVPDLPTSDPLQDVDERTRAVLDAYRELVAEFTPAP